MQNGTTTYQSTNTFASAYVVRSASPHSLVPSVLLVLYDCEGSASIGLAKYRLAPNTSRYSHLVYLWGNRRRTGEECQQLACAVCSPGKPVVLTEVLRAKGVQVVHERGKFKVRVWRGECSDCHSLLQMCLVTCTDFFPLHLWLIWAWLR